MKTHLYLPLLASAALLCALPSTADEIKLKSGQTLSGRITYESEDMVRMEVTISASIKETKVVARDEIESIVKDAPDDVEFGKIQQLVPTGSMISAENYRTMLGTPEAFLKSFPGSKHTAKVTEIRDTLAKELDLVERGHIKVDGDWYNPQDKIDFKELIDSRIRFVRMEGYSRGGNLNSYIAAMREYEVIEKRYNGSPAFPKAIELALQIVPKLGQQLQTLVANVDYHNAEYQKSFDASTAEAQARLKEARDREDQSFVDSIAKDKKEGIKWTQLNPRNKQAIEDYLKFAGNEMGRLRTYNLAQLTAQAELLVAADKLIAENKIGDARTKLGEAAALTGQATKPADSTTPKSKSKGKSTSAAPASSYLAALNNKINAKLNEEKEKEKERVAASKSEALTNKLKAGAPDEEATDTAEAPEEPTTDEAAETDAAEQAAPKKPATGDDDLAALTSSKKAAPKKEEEGEKSKAKAKSKPKKKAADDDSDDSTGEKKSKDSAGIEDEEEGGFSFKWIIWGVTGLVVVALVVMKVLGIGGKKGGED